MQDPLRLAGTAVGGRYVVGDCLGAYGSRVVYRAEHQAFGIPVRLEVITAGDQQRRAFMQAGRTILELASKFSPVVQVRDGGLHDGPSGPLAFVASEWLDGPTLAEAVTASGKGKFPLDQVIDWMDPVLETIIAAHRKGVVHGHFDLSAFFVVGNLGPRAALKVDGLVEGAWRPQLQGGSMPMRAPVPGFAAPELNSADTTLVGPWTDVYGLAAVLSVLLCGSSSSAMRERGLPSGVQYAFDKALNARIDARFKTLASFRASMMDGLAEFGSRGAANPRRTMVVADVDSQMAEGSAGGFEVKEEEDIDAHKPTMGKARVRLAYTQPAMDVPEALAKLQQSQSPPSGAHPVQRPVTGPQPAVGRKQSGRSFVAVLILLLVVAVGGGVAVGYTLFR
jgi:hypothetical protein